MPKRVQQFGQAALSTSMVALALQPSTHSITPTLLSWLIRDRTSDLCKNKICHNFLHSSNFPGRCLLIMTVKDLIVQAQECSLHSKKKLQQLSERYFNKKLKRKT